ncbi:hypothetical protein H0H92_008746, partial [Tricholoma furcatifolium]
MPSPPSIAYTPNEYYPAFLTRHGHNIGASPSRLKMLSTIRQPEPYHVTKSPAPPRAPSAVMNVMQHHLQDVVNIAFNIVAVVLNVKNKEDALKQLAEHVCALVYLVLHRAKTADESFILNLKELHNTLLIILEWSRAHCNTLSPGMQSENPIPDFCAHLESFLVFFG